MGGPLPVVSPRVFRPLAPGTELAETEPMNKHIMTSCRRAASFVSIAVGVVALVLTTGCGSDPDAQTSTESALSSNENFSKHGNNGTVSCDTYCAGAEWLGGTGTCVSAFAYAVPCDHATGLLTNTQLSCICTLPNGDQFAKDGNNGTVSCDTYCAGAQWGAAGGCSLADGTNVPCVGTCYEAYADPVDCSQSVGYLSNGQELYCVCHGTCDPAYNGISVECE